MPCQVLTAALVTRIIFQDSISDDDGLTAIGAEFIHCGKIYLVKCRKELILSAGYFSLVISPSRELTFYVEKYNKKSADS